MSGERPEGPFDRLGAGFASEHPEDGRVEMEGNAALGIFTIVVIVATVCVLVARHVFGLCG